MIFCRNTSQIINPVSEFLWLNASRALAGGGEFEVHPVFEGGFGAVDDLQPGVELAAGFEKSLFQPLQSRVARTAARKLVEVGDAQVREVVGDGWLFALVHGHQKSGRRRGHFQRVER